MELGRPGRKLGSFRLIRQSCLLVTESLALTYNRIQYYILHPLHRYANFLFIAAASFLASTSLTRQSVIHQSAPQIHPSAQSLPLSLPHALRHLRITEIHLRMLLLELLQHIHLLAIVTRRQAHLLLALIVHHLLDHAPRLAVQIPQLAVLGLDLRRVEVVGRVGRDGRPPLHLVRLVEMDADVLAGRGGLERPGGLGGPDLEGEVAL